MARGLNVSTLHVLIVSCVVSSGRCAAQHTRVCECIYAWMLRRNCDLYC